MTVTSNDLINATFDLGALWEWISAFFKSMFANPAVDGYIQLAEGYLAMVPALVVPGALLILSLIQAFFGKKLLGLQKFLGCFTLGFVCGVAIVHPFVAAFIQGISAEIIGLIIGIVCGLLCKPVYFLTYVAVAGYSVYNILFGGYYLPETITAMTKGNLVVCAVAAGVAVLLVLIFRKWIEMLGTAALGGWCTYLSADALLIALTGAGVAAFPMADVIKIAAIVVVAFLGFVVQVKTRRRY